MQDKSSGSSSLKGFAMKVTVGTGEKAVSASIEIGEQTCTFVNDCTLEKEELQSINKVNAEIMTTIINATTMLYTSISADSKARSEKYAEEAKTRNENETKRVENETKRLQNEIDENEKRREHEVRMHELRTSGTTKSPSTSR